MVVSWGMVFVKIAVLAIVIRAAHVYFAVVSCMFENYRAVIFYLKLALRSHLLTKSSDLKTIKDQLKSLKVVSDILEIVESFTVEK